MNLSTNNQTVAVASKTASIETLPEHSISTYILNIFLTALCVIIVCCDVIAIRVMRRCKRVAYQCLQLSISYLTGEIVALMIFIVHQLLIFGFDINIDILYNSRITTVAIMHCISSASMAAIILERVFALKANLQYTLALKRIKIHFIIALIWMSHLLLIAVVFSISFQSNCDLTVANCDFTEVNKYAKYLFLILTVVYDTTMITANVIAYNVARRHAKEIDVITKAVANDKSKYPGKVSERQYASIVVFVKIVTFYLLLKIPLTLTMLLGTNFPDIRDGTPMRTLRSVSYFFYLISCFVNLYFYIFKIKECRMNLFFVIGKYVQKYKQRAHALRLEVFDIVVCSQRGRNFARN